MFFKTLNNFFLEHEQYRDNNTLLIDDSWYKCEHNRPGSFIILPRIAERPREYLTTKLKTWLEGWFQVEDRLEYAKQFQNAPRTPADDFVKNKLAEGGLRMSFNQWT